MTVFSFWNTHIRVMKNMGASPANIYLIKFNNRNNRISCEIYSESTVKPHERPHSGVVVVNFEHIFCLFLVFLLLILIR